MNPTIALPADLAAGLLTELGAAAIRRGLAIASRCGLANELRDIISDLGPADRAEAARTWLSAWNRSGVPAPIGLNQPGPKPSAPRPEPPADRRDAGPVPPAASMGPPAGEPARPRPRARAERRDAGHPKPDPFALLNQLRAARVAQRLAS